MNSIESGVSVIIPAYNAARYICHAIDSTLNQETEFPVEIIVINDGSTDDTARVLQMYRSRIKVIDTPNHGVSSARNVGINSANCELIALLDADDRMNAGRLAAQASGLQGNPKAVLSCSSIELIDDRGNLIEEQPKPIAHRPDTHGNITSHIFSRNFIATSSVMLRRSTVSAINGFSEQLSHSEDCELWLRLSLLGEFIFLEERLTQYRVHSTQSVHNELAMAKGRIAAREHFLRNLPQNQNIINNKHIQKVMAELAIDYGYRLAQKGEHAAARSACQIGLRYSPLSLPLWKMYLKSYFIHT